MEDQPRICAHSKCANVLARKPGERSDHWKVRATCCQECAIAYNAEKRRKPPVVKVEQQPELPPVAVPFLVEQLPPPPGFVSRMMRGALL